VVSAFVQRIPRNAVDDAVDDRRRSIGQRRLRLLPGVPDQDEPSPWAEHPGDLPHRLPRREPVERLADEDGVDGTVPERNRLRPLSSTR
jgi:hypothetical protein